MEAVQFVHLEDTARDDGYGGRSVVSEEKKEPEEARPKIEFVPTESSAIR